ncbi:hypothetical protein [Neisseria meningitidis]|uniref:hypothetical protein n=1 Tax=Neisseria meningitidis TaxID=487 RepID=UPI001895D94F|nr:hypothetical protein [Neisseria meningitidis]
MAVGFGGAADGHLVGSRGVGTAYLRARACAQSGGAVQDGGNAARGGRGVGTG